MLIHHVTHPSFVKVIDFGIARAIRGPGLGTMGILGTIGYIALNKRMERLSRCAYGSLRLRMPSYELLTGQLPFEDVRRALLRYSGGPSTGQSDPHNARSARFGPQAVRTRHGIDSS